MDINGAKTLEADPANVFVQVSGDVIDHPMFRDNMLLVGGEKLD